MADEGEGVDDLGEGLLLLSDLVPVEVDRLEQGQIVAAEVEGQRADHVVGQVELAQVGHLAEDELDQRLEIVNILP